LPVEAFGINKVSGDHPAWWWWPVVIAAAVGVAGCAIWGIVSQRRGPPRTVVDQRGGAGSGNTPQPVVGEGHNVNMKADNNSVAAYKIDTLNWGTPTIRPNDEEDPQRR
jgi:hypothetical protein